MADIKATVDAMAKKDIAPDPSVVVDPVPASLTATKIQTIAKELAKPWINGTALHRFAKNHGVSLQVVKEIQIAVAEKAATFAPAEPPSGEGTGK